MTWLTFATGIRLNLPGGPAGFDIEIERAPDDGTGNAPDTANSTTFPPIAAAARRIFTDHMSDDGNRRWYRSRLIRDNWTPGPWTDWYGALPTILVGLPPPPPPTIKEPTVELLDEDQVDAFHVDVTLRVTDFSLSGGTLELWTAPDAAGTPILGGAGDDTIDIPAGQKETNVGPTDSTALNDVRVSQSFRKRIYAKYVNTLGQETIQRGFWIGPELDIIKRPDNPDTPDDPIDPDEARLRPEKPLVGGTGMFEKPGGPLVDNDAGAIPRKFGDPEHLDEVVQHLTATGNIDKLAEIAGLAAQLISRQQHGVFLESFETDIDDWTVVQHNGVRSIVLGPGTVGGKVLQAVGGTEWYVFPANIPYDSTKLYRIRAHCEQTVDPTNGEKSIFVGVEGVAADGVTLVNTSGADSHSQQHYIAASSVELGVNTPTLFTGWFKGHGNPVNNSNDPLFPSPLHPNVRYFRPVFLLNYNGGDGTAIIDSIRIDVMDEEAEARTYSGLQEGGVGVFTGGLIIPDEYASA